MFPSGKHQTLSIRSLLRETVALFSVLVAVAVAAVVVFLIILP
jgi:hypothetical protein